MMADLHALAADIGPRGTGTPEEAVAADYVANRLTSMGIPVERHTFQAVTSQNAFPIAINLVALLAVILYSLNKEILRSVAAGLALTTAPMLWQTIRTSNIPLRFLLPMVTSQNVIASIKPKQDVRQHVVLLAHLDTNRCRMIWQSSTVRYLEPLTYLTLVILALLGLIYLIGVLFHDPGWVWWISLLFAAYILGSLVLLWIDDRTQYSPGAHDNAASVAVALAISRRFKTNPLQNTHLWVAFTGAEETDHSGLKVFLDKHKSILTQSAFIGLEGVGSGDIVFLSRQGLCAHYRPDPEMLNLTKRVAAHSTDLNVQEAQMTMEDEIGTLRRRGYKAICIAGMDPDTGSLPRWHRPDDTVDSVSIEIMETAADFVTRMLREIDNPSSLKQEG